MKRILLCCFAIVLTSNIGRSQTEVTFYTSMGDFVVETYDTLQPITAGNFIDLVNAKFYDEIIFHRVVEDFVVQGGDPLGTGFGGPGYSIPDEFDPETSNTQRTVAMANSGPDTGGSQFFFNLVNNSFLDDDHPVFGEVISGWEIVQDIGMVPTVDNKPVTDVVMDSVRVTVRGPHVGILTQKINTINLSIYPIPTKEKITIDLGDDFKVDGNYSIKITNVLGETIYNGLMTKNQSTIDISNICPAGIYFVNVTNDELSSSATRTIVIE